MNKYKTKTEIYNYYNNIEKIEHFVINNKIINFSIQAWPGAKFWINSNSNPIIIGPNGLFSWEINQTDCYVERIEYKNQQGDQDKEPTENNFIIITYCYIENE